MHDAGPIAEQPNADGPEEVVAPDVRPVAQPEVAPPEPVIEEPAIYLKAPEHGALWCCEILSNVLQFRRSFASLAADEPEIESVIHPQSMVISQDCDLEQDFKTRQKGEPSSLPSVLLCEVEVADTLKDGVPPGKDIWKRIKQNKDERYQFLSAVPPEVDFANQGLPALGIDFRRYFTVPTDELYEQFNLGAQRRCRLASPYKEHFMNRFANFMARVGLPLNHED